MPEVIFNGPAGRIEGRYHHSKKANSPVALVLHPHPQFGGTMNNPVTYALFQAFVQRGFSVLRFNFRGVGASAGAWDEGRGETGDALAVIEWARRRWPGRPLWLAGFSFGAFVALNAAARAAPAALVTIAPAVSRFPHGELADPGCPWLVVQGEADELTDYREVVAWAGRRPASLALLPETSHFFHGRLGDLQQVVQDFLGGAGERERT